MSKAKIIDYRAITKDRFKKWAQQYLEMPPHFFENGVIRFEYVIIAYLIEKGVFTMDELRKDLRENKIYLHERIFQQAIVEIENQKKK